MPQAIIGCCIFSSKKTIGLSLNKYGINSIAAQFVRSINVQFISRLIYINQNQPSPPQNINPPNYNMFNSPFFFRGYKMEHLAITG